MTWEEALTLIKGRIVKGMKLDSAANYGRPVLEVPPFACTAFDFNGDEGYKVKIGAEKFIEVPVSMLKRCYEASLENGGIYKTSTIYGLYPEQLALYGSYVHVVGNIFAIAGLAEKVKGGYKLH